MKDYYEILGISAESSAVELKAAYRRLARKYHPDVWGDERMFRTITEAYEALLTGPIPKQSPPAQPKDVFVKRGEDIHADIVISAEEAANGAARTVNVMQSKQCPNCQGHNCPNCGGEGIITQYKKITVKIPPNIQNGYRLRVAGEGNEGVNGGANGDLYLRINIENNSSIKYNGADILYELPVAPFDAVLGGELPVPAFDGNIMLKIPPFTKSGQTFRLAGQGRVAGQGKKSGDMVVTVCIEIPSSLSQDEIKLYKKLKALHDKHG